MRRGPPRLDLTGKKFHRLTAIRRVGDSCKWEYLCDCGKIIIKLPYNISHGGARSCGCLKAEVIRARNDGVQECHQSIEKFGHGVCPKCKVDTQKNDFAKVNAKKIFCCKKCRAISKRKSSIQKTYGISFEQYQEMSKRQGNRCAICLSPPSGNSPSGLSLHVDHCHVSGKVRGLLCGQCNIGIGNLGDDHSRLRAAADYLERNQ